MAGSVMPAELRQLYQAGGEIAIVDAREEGSFHDRHLLTASCLPLSRLELIAPGLLPRRSAPIVVCDDGEGLAERAAARLVGGGYTDVSVLDGGAKAWEAAGVPVFSVKGATASSSSCCSRSKSSVGSTTIPAIPSGGEGM